MAGPALGRRGKGNGDKRSRRSASICSSAAARAFTRLIEDERWLAVVLLLPTVVLLGMFIAYPFVQGVLLAITDTKVGIPGRFVGVQNFIALFHDSIFRTAVWNTFVYTAVATVFKLGLGLWLALLLNRNFKGKA